MKSKNKIFLLLFLSIILFLLVTPQVNANSADPMYHLMDDIKASFEIGLAGAFSDINLKILKGDLVLAILNAIAELTIFYFILFRKNIKKKKYFLTIFITNIITWFTFLSTTVFSLWYILSLYSEKFLTIHPNIVGGYTLLLFELIIFIIESIVFVMMFRKEYKPWKIIRTTIIANMTTLILSIIFILFTW